MGTEAIVALIKFGVSILFAAGLVAIFYRTIRDELLPRMSRFKAFGVELTFVRVELDSAITKQAARVSENDRSQVLRRAQRVAPLLQGALILWVDDHPEGNIPERRILRSFGTFVDMARSTDDALSMLQQRDYDVVISDIKRDGVQGEEGLNLLAKMKASGLYRWTIFYVGQIDPARGTPPDAFGITNRPDHLLHYIIDVLERERGLSS